MSPFERLLEEYSTAIIEHRNECNTEGYRHGYEAAARKRLGDVRNKVIAALQTPPEPGSSAIGVRCHGCGELPKPSEPACSWTNSGEALCFKCGHLLQVRSLIRR